MLLQSDLIHGVYSLIRSKMIKFQLFNQAVAAKPSHILYITACGFYGLFIPVCATVLSCIGRLIRGELFKSELLNKSII